MELFDMTITDIHEGLIRKEYSCREVVAAYLDRCAKLEPVLHAFLFLDKENALRQANAVDRKIGAGNTLGLLEGQPIAVKDLIQTKGIPTTAGSKILEKYTPPYDATVMEKLHAAGVVLLGKTNCDEFGMGASGENSAFGPTKNPWNTEHVPGGSSSGSAAAVASGEAVAAVGTDTGGSIRQPSAFCGIVGVKPTYGRVSRYGQIALASSLDQIGPMTRTVRDAALLFNVLIGKDPHDATSVDKPSISVDTIQKGSVDGLRIGLPQEYFIGGMDRDVERIIRDTAKLLTANGARIVDVGLPHTAYALAAYYIILPAEASSNLSKYDGIRFGLSQKGKDLADGYFLTRGQGFGAEVKRRIMLGTYTLSAGYHDHYYNKAQKVRSLIRRDFSDVFKNVDALITPTTPTPAFRLGEKADPLMMYLSDIFTVAANIAGMPALSVPAGMVDGLPVGVQIMGPMWSEELLLSIGQNIEKTLAMPLRLPSDI